MHLMLHLQQHVIYQKVNTVTILERSLYMTHFLMCICCSFVLIVYCAFMSLNAVNLVCAFKNVKAQQGLEISFRNKS